MPITSTKVLQKMNDIDHASNTPYVNKWHILRRWLLEDEQIHTDGKAGVIVCPGCGELKLEETIYCTNCGADLKGK